MISMGTFYKLIFIIKDKEDQMMVDEDEEEEEEEEEENEEDEEEEDEEKEEYETDVREGRIMREATSIQNNNVRSRRSLPASQFSQQQLKQQLKQPTKQSTTRMTAIKPPSNIKVF